LIISLDILSDFKLQRARVKPNYIRFQLLTFSKRLSVDKFWSSTSKQIKRKIIWHNAQWCINGNFCINSNLIKNKSNGHCRYEWTFVVQEGKPTCYYKWNESLERRNSLSNETNKKKTDKQNNIYQDSWTSKIFQRKFKEVIKKKSFPNLPIGE
jgi:hypothetical protein